MKTAVILPCYKVKNLIVTVVKSIPQNIDFIIVVDDACPQESGKFLKEQINDPRLTVITHEKNKGVGGAMITGYQKSIELGADIAIKLDGDGQMDANLIPRFIEPISAGRADYTKGNRFFKRNYLSKMPLVRLFGNSGLSLCAKVVTGYWKIMDPTNGFTAIHTKVLRQIELNHLEERYYFESDLLFQLSLIRAMVLDIPMPSHYGEEESSLKIWPILKTWPKKMIARFFKRIIIQYYIRDFTSASMELFVGIPLMIFGIIFGTIKFCHYSEMGLNTPSGVVMIAALPIFLGFQLILSAFHYDINNTPSIAIHIYLP